MTPTRSNSSLIERFGVRLVTVVLTVYAIALLAQTAGLKLI